MADTYWDLFWGYSAIWLFVAFFLFRVSREHLNTRKQLTELREQILVSSKDN